MLVLQHCRGIEQIDVDSDSSSDSEFKADGALPENSHRMVSYTNLTYIGGKVILFLRMTQLFFGRHLKGIQQYDPAEPDQFLFSIFSSA